MGTMLGLSFLVLSAAVLSASEDTQKKPGDGVTLQCRVHSNIAVMAWKHQSVGDVIVLRNNHSSKSNQHPSFRGRVNYTYKDGVFNVNLKNVTVNDSGTYECVIGLKNRARAPVSIRNISLTVTDSGLKAGHTEEGGSKDGGNEDRGSTKGGSEDGGNEDGGSTKGGSEDGGNEDRGSTKGGSTEGGSEEGGNLRRRSRMALIAAVIFVLCVIVIVLVVYKRPMKKKSEQPAADEKHQLSSPEPVEVQCQSDVASFFLCSSNGI